MIKPLSLIAVILCGLGIALYFYEHGAEQGQENLSGQILLKQLDTKNLNKNMAKQKTIDSCVQYVLAIMISGISDSGFAF